MGERPHRTLKERVRCLLYTAAFGLEFWSDSLLHSVWLYNRTFHRALDMSPYKAYTKQTLTVNGLLTFDAALLPRNPKNAQMPLTPTHTMAFFLATVPQWTILSIKMSMSAKNAQHTTITTMN